VSLTICVISDTHGKHREITIPPAEVLVHCGDTVGRNSREEVIDFLEWFESQPHPTKLYCAGNHDGLYQRFPKEAREFVRQYAPSAKYLEEESIEVGDLKWFFSPYTPTFFDWYFMADRGPAIQVKWDKIPKDTQVLVTHGPAYGRLDRVMDARERQGCRNLADTIKTLPALKGHFFGHLHLNGGQQEVHDGVLYVNAAIMDERYCPVNPPQLVQL
jgi:hypothetical protein